MTSLERNHGQTSIYLNEHDKEMVTRLQKRTGMSRSELVRTAIQRMYYGERSDQTARLLEIAEEIKRLA